LRDILDRLVSKGAIMGGSVLEKRGKQRYSKAQFAIGIYEFQVDRLSKEFEQDAQQYFDEAFFTRAFTGSPTHQMRTIPIGQSVSPRLQVGVYDNIRSLVKAQRGGLAVINCVCRQGSDLMGEPCKQTNERKVCLMLGAFAAHTVKAGIGRAVTAAEMLDILDRAEEEGLVLQPENSQDPTFICCCCGCCCGILTSAKKLKHPAECFHTNYIAEVNTELCTGCAICTSRCQMEAILVSDDKAEVAGDRCIGCGLCVSRCPEEAVSLIKREDELVPPKNQAALYGQILRERFGPWGMIKIAGKMMLGRKV
jgi:ferredoxin